MTNFGKGVSRLHGRRRRRPRRADRVLRRWQLGARAAAAQRRARRRRRHRQRAAPAGRGRRRRRGDRRLGRGRPRVLAQGLGHRPERRRRAGRLPSLSGCAEASAGEPACRPEGTPPTPTSSSRRSSRAAASQQTRVLVNRLRGSQYDGATAADGLSTPGTDERRRPRSRDDRVRPGLRHLGRAGLEQRGRDGARQQRRVWPGARRSTASRRPRRPYRGPRRSPACSRRSSPGSRTPGTTGPAEIRVRYEPRASTLGPEHVVLLAAAGAPPTPRAASRSTATRAATPRSPGSRAPAHRREIVVDQLYQPPGVAPPPRWPTSRTAQPVLSWSPSSARWGPITYTVTRRRGAGRPDRRELAPVPAALADGPHSWRVTATNPAGLTSTSKAARVFVDTVAPHAVRRVRQAAAGRRGRPRCGCSTRDAPPAGLTRRPTPPGVAG